jgi:putative FmdB family regulatory protein
MPTYVYECAKCGEELEVWQSFQDEPLKRHKGGCGGKLTKVLQPVGILLKGPGFYKTDSREAGKRNGNGKSDRSSDSGDAKSGSDKPTKADKPAAADGKGASKPDSKRDSKSSTKAASTT